MEKIQNETQWHYDAFISYRHTEPDSFVAQTLHKQLENFRLPANVVRARKQSGIEGKTRIRRVFRDREELPLVSNLADPITEALAQSEYLIVICSPRLNESMWCRKEIETFIHMHDREHVLAVLVEGEPEEAFPEELLYREVKETQNDGSVIIKKIPVEPLAADVRGESRKEVRSKMKSELLRLAAPMFGCSYDELRQRHREQRIRKILVTSVSVSAVCLTVGMVSTTMALRIHSQNVKITEQAQTLAEQSEKITEQYEEAVRMNCITQAGAAQELLEDGDRIEAVRTALSVYPGDGTAERVGVSPAAEELPYTAQAAYALTESLRLYENGDAIRPDRKLKADTTIRFVQTSPMGGKILTVDEYGGLVVWDAGNGRRLAELTVDEGGLTDEGEVCFIDEEHFLYPKESGVACYDMQKQADCYNIDRDSLPGMLREIAAAAQTDLAAIQCQNGFLLIRPSTGEVCREESWDPLEDGAQMQGACRFSADGAYYAVAVEENSSGEKERKVRVYRAQDGELLCSVPLAYSHVEDLRFADGVLYLVNDGDSGEGDNLFDTAAMRGKLTAYDLAGKSVLWEYELEGGWLYETSVASAPDSRYMVCSSYDELYALDRTDGRVLERFSFGSEVVKLGNYVDSDAFLVFTREGTWHYVNLDTMTDYVGNTFQNCTSTNVKAFGMGDDYWYTLPYGEKELTLYRMVEMEKDAQLCEFTGQIREAALSCGGDVLVAAVYDQALAVDLEVIDTDDGTTRWSLRPEEASEDGYYVACTCGSFARGEREGVFAVTSGNILLLDMESGERIADCPFDETSGIDKNEKLIGSWSADGETVLYTTGDGKLHRYETEGESLRRKTLVLDALEEHSGIAARGDFFAYMDRTDDSLHLVRWEISEDREEYGEQDCCEVAKLTDMQAAYVESLFFDEDLSLYAVYRNGDVRVFDLRETDGVELTERQGYAGLEESLRGAEKYSGRDYDFLAGEWDGGYLTTADGELTAHIEGALAVDGERGVIYQKHGCGVYKIPVYTREEIYERAVRELENS